MRLCTTVDGIGRVEADELALLALPHADLAALLTDLDSGLDAAASASVRARAPLDNIELLAPVLRPGKVWIVGLNYESHAAETGRGRPTRPLVFLTPGSAVTASGRPIVLPSVAPGAVDYEGEVAIVIGSRATNVSEANAWKHIAGVTACNDVSARDLQRRAMKPGSGLDIALSKSLDTFKPLGPFLATVDEYDDLDDIALTTHVNGEQRQRATTAELFFSMSELVSYISRYTTLEPGDIISTGSPAGAGFVTEAFLQPGDVVEIAVAGAGVLRNPVVAAAASE